jgi:hypothetical protein
MTQPAIALALRSSVLRGSERYVEVTRKLKLHSNFGDVSPLTEGAELARTLLFDVSSSISATLGQIHPQFRKGQFHPSTSHVLGSLITHLQLGSVRCVSQIHSTVLEGSLVVVGGPVSSLHARLILGCGGPSSLFGVDLPIRFDCVSTAPALSDLNPWKVVVEGRSSQQECLVITSLPLDSSDRLVVIAGLHSAGTRAVEFVLRNDQGILDHIYNRARHFVGWQALVEVKATGRQRPEGIADATVFEIRNVDFDRVVRSIRSRLFLDKAEIEMLLQELPQDGGIDPSDPSTTSMVIPLYKHRLQNRSISSMVPKGSSASLALGRDAATSTSGRHARRSRELAPDPPARGTGMSHAKYGKSENESVRKGRPPKGQPHSVRLHLFQVNLSDADEQRLEDIMQMSGVASKAEVIRQAVRELHQRLQSSDRATRK